MNIKYIPPNNSNWPDRVQVDSLLVVQYRSIRKQRLYQPNDDTNPWQDGDALRLYIDFSKLSGRVVTQNSLRAECKHNPENQLKETEFVERILIGLFRHLGRENPK